MAKNIKLHIPEQTLKSLSFCNGKLSGFEYWLAHLPMGNASEAAKRVFRALLEMNQWKVSPSTRLEALELIRPVMYQLCAILEKQYLNQSITLSSEQLNASNLDQALHFHLATGYKIIALESLTKSVFFGGGKLKANLGLVLHRAASELDAVLTHCALMFSVTPKRMWYELHQLYLIAKEKKVLQSSAPDYCHTVCHELTFEKVYLSIILLSCSKSNQLRQQEVVAIRQNCHDWCQYVKLEALSEEWIGDSALLVVDFLSDHSAAHRTSEEIRSLQMTRHVDTSDLVNRIGLTLLKEKLDHHEPLRFQADLEEEALQHLILAWSQKVKRISDRQDCDATLLTSIGLTATHYYLSDQQNASGPPDNNQTAAHAQDFSGNVKVLREMGAVDSGVIEFEDPTSLAFGFDDELQASSAVESHSAPGELKRHAVHKAKMINTSFKGYRLEWQAKLPVFAQAGELLAVQEENQSDWCLCVIRWMMHDQKKGTSSGVEVLSNEAQACWVKLHPENSESKANYQYTRALYLPANSSLQTPESLIVPNIPFKKGHRVLMAKNSDQQTVELTNRVNGTNRFGQFEFTYELEAE